MSAANLAPTPLLDHQHSDVSHLADELGRGKLATRDYLRAAHRHLIDHLKAVYDLEEHLPVSKILAQGTASCSQRIACFEALARAGGVGTRVRTRYLSGAYWAPRLPLLKPFLRKPSLIPWPQFEIDGRGWVDFEEVFGTLDELAPATRRRFTNRGESMFEAIGHSVVDFSGKLKQSGHPRGAELDLSEFVVEERETFDSRDEMFERYDPDPSAAGRALFNMVYGGRPIRRETEA